METIRAGSLEQRQQLLGEEEGRAQVDVQHQVPVGDGHGREAAGRVGAGVIHQQVQPGFVGPERLREPLRTLRIGQVRAEADAGSADGGDDLFGRLAGAAGIAAGDVGLHAPLDEARRDHPADAARAPGDQGDLAGDVEKRVGHACLRLSSDLCGQSSSGANPGLASRFPAVFRYRNSVNSAGRIQQVHHGGAGHTSARRGARRQ